MSREYIQRSFLMPAMVVNAETEAQQAAVVVVASRGEPPTALARTLDTADMHLQDPREEQTKMLQ